MAGSLTRWCNESPENITPPPTQMFKEGFKPTTVGNNLWLNYFFNMLTHHVQVPPGVMVPFFGNSISGQYDGYLLADGSTVGSLGSAATHASDDYVNLFSAAWHSAPISGGRGASVSADWAANKTITLPNMAGKVIAGYSTSGEFANFYGDVGQETHTLLPGEQGDMTFPINEFSGVSGGPNGSVTFAGGEPTTGVRVGLGSGPTAPPLTITGTFTGTTTGGGGQPHNNIQPSMATYWHVKF